ncbi:hypothetical protein GWI33_000998 [Rhynchophorus ferrugineus]|uniref:Uncharacterized protein n=1 Tax=Rhynchophorus ferrugineus TaxID=354439 RepID=A0A834HKP7_RHYFE|nr:hypothetical protein GWI33_000998 [Rhynchophorus ferrugineus]
MKSKKSRIAFRIGTTIDLPSLTATGRNWGHGLGEASQTNATAHPITSIGIIIIVASYDANTQTTILLVFDGCCFIYFL